MVRKVRESVFYKLIEIKCNLCQVSVNFQSGHYGLVNNRGETLMLQKDMIMFKKKQTKNSEYLMYFHYGFFLFVLSKHATSKTND